MYKIYDLSTSRNVLLFLVLVLGCTDKKAIQPLITLDSCFQTRTVIPKNLDSLSMMEGEGHNLRFNTFDYSLFQEGVMGAEKLFVKIEREGIARYVDWLELQSEKFKIQTFHLHLNYYSYYKFLEGNNNWVNVRRQTLIDCFYSDLETFFKKSFNEKEISPIVLEFFDKFHDAVSYKIKIDTERLKLDNNVIFQGDSISIPKKWIVQTDSILVYQSHSYIKHVNEDYFVTFWNKKQNRIEYYVYHPIIRKLGID